MMANYPTFAQLKSLFQEVGYKFNRLGGAYTVKGNIAFSSLPAPSANTSGFVYNITNDFTTTADFVEGAGKKYPAGTNVVIADVTPKVYSVVENPEAGSNPKYNGWYEKDIMQDVYFLTADSSIVQDKTYYIGTPDTPAYKYDVIANFVDTEGIADRITSVGTNLAPSFSNATAYSVGDIVVYNDILYRCRANHAAGAWESNDFEEITVKDIVDSSEPDGLTTAQMNELLGLI